MSRFSKLFFTKKKEEKSFRTGDEIKRCTFAEKLHKICKSSDTHLPRRIQLMHSKRKPAPIMTPYKMQFFIPIITAKMPTFHREAIVILFAYRPTSTTIDDTQLCYVVVNKRFMNNGVRKGFSNRENDKKTRIQLPRTRGPLKKVDVAGEKTPEEEWTDKKK